MLSKMENKIMGALYFECKDKRSTLITPTDLTKIAGVENITDNQLEKIMNALYMDGYFDLIYSDRHGEVVYCISLTEKGKGYMRNRTVMKRTLIFRLCLTVSLAFLSFIIGLILRAIF